MGDRAAEHGERLIHHKLGNKEERGCRGRAGEPANYDILARARTTKLCLFVKSCRPKLSQINWRRTAARTYSLLGPRLPADLYFLPRFLAGAFREERERERERLPWRFETPFIINANVRAIPFAAFYFRLQLNNPIWGKWFYFESHGAFTAAGIARWNAAPHLYRLRYLCAIEIRELWHV